MPYFGNFGFTEIKKKYCQIQSKKNTVKYCHI